MNISNMSTSCNVTSHQPQLNVNTSACHGPRTSFINEQQTYVLVSNKTYLFITVCFTDSDSTHNLSADIAATETLPIS